MINFNTIEIIPDSMFRYNLLIILAGVICGLLVMTLSLKSNNIKTNLIMVVFGLALIVSWNKANNSRIVYVKAEINEGIENIDKLVDNKTIFEHGKHYYFVTSMKNGAVINLKNTQTLEDVLNGRLTDILKTIEREKRIS